MTDAARFLITLGECDCCSAPNRVLRHVIAPGGGETAACALCRGGKLADDITDLEDEIERSWPFGFDAWSYITALQEALIEARAKS